MATGAELRPTGGTGTFALPPPRPCPCCVCITSGTAGGGCETMGTLFSLDSA